MAVHSWPLKNSFLELNTAAVSTWPEAFWEGTCVEAETQRDERMSSWRKWVCGLDWRNQSHLG